MSGAFELDERLAGDSCPICELTLCEVRLMEDSRFAWLILVPRRAGAVEIIDLAVEDRVQLMSEIAHVSRALKACAPCDKLNVAALGNMVPQLHVHVIARREGDAAWPGPVWGKGAPEPYDGEARRALCQRLRAQLLA